MTSVHTPPSDFSGDAHVNSMDQYRSIYDESVNDPEAFWGEVAERITWRKRWDKTLEWDFGKGVIKWFEARR